VSCRNGTVAHDREVFEGVRIAKRGEPGTPHNEDAGAVRLDGAFCLLLQAGTWVSLEPCYEVPGGTSEQDPLVVTRKDALTALVPCRPQAAHALSTRAADEVSRRSSPSRTMERPLPTGALAPEPGWRGTTQLWVTYLPRLERVRSKITAPIWTCEFSFPRRSLTPCSIQPEHGCAASHSRRNA